MLLTICMLLSLINVIFGHNGNTQPFHFYPVNPMTAKHCPNTDQYEYFLGKCFCALGWELDTNSGNCSIPLIKNGNCECPPDIPVAERSSKYLRNSSWEHVDGYVCSSLCRWNSQLGTIRSNPEEWDFNQKAKQWKFYNNDLPKASWNSYNHLRQRLDEFAESFDEYRVLNHSYLGNVCEFGAGGWTQLRSIMSRVNVTVDAVTLVEPQMQEYRKIKGCSYQHGQLLGLPTTLVPKTVEEFGKENTVQFDTIIDMNVLVYVQDALVFLTTLYNSLKMNGTLIFHERWFPDSVKSEKCFTAGYGHNVIQVRKPLLDHFLSKFSTDIYINTNQSSHQINRSKGWCQWQDDEIAYWVVAKKIA